MYYAGALMLGSEGLRTMLRFAANPEARDTSRKPIVRLAGIKPTAPAWEALTIGTPLAPEQVRMFVALDDDPRAALKTIIATLHQHHRLPIGLVVVKDGKITVQLPAG
jgi:hypothetical protein